MLKKFVNIKNISRFKSFNASGDVELKRHSLLYGENGRGKTTVCAILRSLQTGVGAHVIGRTMLGSTDAPGIRILSDDLTLIFSNGLDGRLLTSQKLCRRVILRTHTTATGCQVRRFGCGESSLADRSTFRLAMFGK